MSEETQEPLAAAPAKVIAKFKSSSTKGGQEAYELTVTDAATSGDVIDAVENAKTGRALMLSAILGDVVEGA